MSARAAILFDFNMKTIKTLLTALSAFFWLAQASAIHVDITNSGHVAVEIDPELQDLQSEYRCTKSEDSPPCQVEPQHTVIDQYDVTLPYEVHRGFSSVSLTSNIEGKTPTEDVQDDSSYVKFSNIPFAEPPLGSLRFKAPVSPQRKSQDVNEGLKERVCPQYQVGWVPKALEFLGCYAGALEEPPDCSFNGNWTDPIVQSDYPSFDGRGFNEKGDSHPFPQSLLAKIF